MAERGEMRWEEEKGHGVGRARLRQGREREHRGRLVREGLKGERPVMHVRMGHSDAVPRTGNLLESMTGPRPKAMQAKPVVPCPRRPGCCASGSYLRGAWERAPAADQAWPGEHSCVPRLHVNDALRVRPGAVRSRHRGTLASGLPEPNWAGTLEGARSCPLPSSLHGVVLVSRNTEQSAPAWGPRQDTGGSSKAPGAVHRSAKPCPRRRKVGAS